MGCFAQVYDKGTISDKFLGRGSIEMSLLATEFAKDEVRRPIKTNISLEGGKGEVVLRTEWVPLDQNPVIRSRSILLPSLFGECNRGVLQARLVRAKDLENMDIIGLSDPYCILKVWPHSELSQFILVIVEYSSVGLTRSSLSDMSLLLPIDWRKRKKIQGCSRESEPCLE